MYLNKSGIDKSKNEISENIDRSGLNIEELAINLGTKVEYLKKVINLESNRIEDVWILRNYLINYLSSIDVDVVEFSVFSGDFRRINGLDKKYIGSGVIKEEIKETVD